MGAGWSDWPWSLYSVACDLSQHFTFLHFSAHQLSSSAKFFLVALIMAQVLQQGRMGAAVTAMTPQELSTETR
jgi:hypothetical protein